MPNPENGVKGNSYVVYWSFGGREIRAAVVEAWPFASKLFSGL
jgi:hypothetical protein